MEFTTLMTPTFSPDHVTIAANQSLDTASHAFCANFRFVVNVVVLGIVAGFGVIGNTLSVVVLQKERCHKTTRFLLQALAIADSMLLVMSVITITLNEGILAYFVKDEMDSKAYRHIAYKFIHPFVYMPLVATIWFTVLIAINRYVVVCHPFRASSFCSLARTRLQVMFVTVMSILLNMPRFFQINLKYHNVTGKITGSEYTHVGPKSTFGIVYNNFIYNIAVLIAPVLILATLSCRLVLGLKRMRQRRAVMALLLYQAAPSISVTSYSNGNIPTTRMINSSTEYVHKKTSNKDKDESNITMVTMIIMAVMIICHTPDRILTILKLTISGRTSGCDSGFFYYFSLLCNIFVLLNSSINFLIYYFLRRRFRYRLYLMLSCRDEQTGSTFNTESMRSRRSSSQSLYRVGNMVPMRYKSDVYMNNNGLKQPYNIYDRRNTR